MVSISVQWQTNSSLGRGGLSRNVLIMQVAGRGRLSNLESWNTNRRQRNGSTMTSHLQYQDSPKRTSLQFTLHRLSSLPEYMTLPLSSAKHTELTSDCNKIVHQALVSLDIYIAHEQKPPQEAKASMKETITNTHMIQHSNQLEKYISTGGSVF